MVLTDYVRVLRGSALQILATVLIALLVAAGYAAFRPLEYTATTTMYVVSQGDNSTSAAYQGAQLSEQRVSSYTQLVGSDRILQEVINRMQLPMSTSELQQSTTAISTLNSVLLDISVVATSPQNAASIANTFAAVLTEVVNEIEKPIVPSEPQLVAIRVVQPAVPPTQSSSTSLLTILAAATFIGLIVGIGIALGRNYLDNTVRSAGQMRSVTNAPNLGTIPFGKFGSASNTLVSYNDPKSNVAESLRQIRANLQFIEVDEPRKVLVVTSAAPGEGKTFTATNLAVSCASAGLNVLLVEADFRRPGAAKLLGLDGSVGLTTVLAGRASVEASIQSWKNGLRVLASGPTPPNPSELLSSRLAAATFNKLRSYYDLILIDTPPVLPVADAVAVASNADGVILACRYGRTTTNQLSDAVENLSVLSVPIVGAVLTMAEGVPSVTYSDQRL